MKFILPKVKKQRIIEYVRIQKIIVELFIA